MIVLLATDIVLSVFMIISLLNAYESSTRGTNTVSRFVRNTSSYFSYKATILIGFIFSAPILFIGIIIGKAWVAAPSIILIVIAMLLKRFNTLSKKRRKDARTVTKASLRAGGVAGGVVAGAGAAAVTATVAPAAIAGVAGVATAVGVNEIAQVSASNMCDIDLVKHPEVEHPEINKEVLAAAYSGALSVCKPEEFMNAAEKVGIPVAGKSLDEVADAVLELAPIAMLAELPDFMSKEDKAMIILGGSEKPCEDCSHCS